ncbi:MAG TPA: type II toxin-antitoxin system VapC family toxin [Candidatus Limnocylindria bacterium]|nr:type II toxin-antitoxin system VapC family toxin [Candidatus Limnocylindria bacterium]
MIVLDASAGVEMLLGTARGAAIGAALAGHRAVAPAHFDAEVFRALRRWQRRRQMTAAEVSHRIGLLTLFAADRIPLPPLLARADALGERFSPPDSLYVATAHALDAELFTCDAPLATACAGVARVRLF